MASKIIWTEIDEAPALATYSLLPIVQAFTKGTGVEVETRDISLAGRVIANFPEYLTESQRIPDYLTQLGELTQTIEANIIKLPNVSASVPQLIEVIAELQSQGYKLPDYPEEPKNAAEKEIQERYAKCLGSAVNPVLREGNSDRRAPLAVKEYARKNPKTVPLSPWEAGSKAHVAHMTGGDFYANEKSVTMENGGDFRIELVADGKTTVLKDKLTASKGEILSSSFMSRNALRKFFADQIEDAKKSGILLSLHLKATMMKISDPIMFGHAVTVFYKEVFEKHAATLKDWASIPTWGSATSTRKSRSSRQPSRPRSRPTSRRSMRSVRRWPWSIPTRGSPTCTPPTTSSSTPPCRWWFAKPARCGTPKGSCRIPRR
jgi:isocitrate dehydrogenase